MVSSFVLGIHTSTPPWILDSKSSPSTSTRDTSAEAVISPMASIATEI
jgi:hypothetical protein